MIRVLKNNKRFVSFPIVCFMFIAIFLKSSLVHADPNKDRKRVALGDLSRVLKDTKPGDTIFVSDGIYNNINLTLTSQPNSVIHILAENPGNVVVSGKSTINIEKSKNLSIQGLLFSEITNPSAIVLNSSSNILIEDNYFFKCGVSRFGFILRIDRGSFNNRIVGNTFDGSKAMSVVVTSRITNAHTKNNTNNIIESNYFVNILSVKTVYPDADGNGMEAIQIGQGVDGTEEWPLKTIVRNNLFEKIRGDGGEIISVKSSNNQIIHNTFLDNKSGITLRLGSNNSVKCNYFDKTSKGIRVFGFGHVIEYNIVNDAEYGVQLPTSNYLRGQRMKDGGYFQQQNVVIENNYILNPTAVAFNIGKGNRKYYPENIVVNNNFVLLDSIPLLYNKSAMIDFLSFFNGLENKIILKNSLNKSFPGDDIRFYFREIRNNCDNFAYLESNDKRVGAKWRRPK